MRSMRGLAVALAAVAMSPASALVFNFTTAVGDSLSGDQAAAFTTAGNAWSSLLTDDITINLKIGFRTFGLVGGISPLGATVASQFTGTRAEISTALISDATSLDDLSALSTFATGTEDEFLLTSAQAKALGFAGNALDGTIEFNSAYNFSTSRNGSGGIAPNSYDLIGVAEHEIAHILGFQSSIDGTVRGDTTILDQYRFSALGAHSITAGASAYFSIDNGLTNLSSFSPGGANQFQASHWGPSVAALMRPAFNKNEVVNITELDLRALDVIGYNRVGAAVPEPAGWATMVLGFGLIGGWRRRARLLIHQQGQ